MNHIEGTAAVTPQVANRCDHCAGKFHPRFAMGGRVHGIRVWVCSPQCWWQLLKVWR